MTSASEMVYNMAFYTECHRKCKSDGKELRTETAEGWRTSKKLTLPYMVGLMQQFYGELKTYETLHNSALRTYMGKQGPIAAFADVYQEDARLHSTVCMVPTYQQTLGSTSTKAKKQRTMIASLRMPSGMSTVLDLPACQRWYKTVTTHLQLSSENYAHGVNITCLDTTTIDPDLFSYKSGGKIRRKVAKCINFRGEALFKSGGAIISVPDDPILGEVTNEDLARYSENGGTTARFFLEELKFNVDLQSDYRLNCILVMAAKWALLVKWTQKYIAHLTKLLLEKTAYLTKGERGILEVDEGVYYYYDVDPSQYMPISDDLAYKVSKANQHKDVWLSTLRAKLHLGIDRMNGELTRPASEARKLNVKWGDAVVHLNWEAKRERRAKRDKIRARQRHKDVLY